MTGIITNVNALTAQRSLAQSNSMVAKSIRNLSTGLRINSAADDAAGLAISERMSAQSAGLGAAERNANDGISLLKTAEGALSETSRILIRMKELATQSANGTNSASDRAALNAEFNQLQSEVTSITEKANFNGINLLDGTFNAKSFQIGVNASESVDVTISAATGDSIGNFRVNDRNQTANYGTASSAVAGTGAVTDNTIGAQTVTVAGNLGSEFISVADNASAKTIAAAVNNVESGHGIQATAHTELQINTVSLDGTVSFDLSTSANTTATNISASVTTGDLSALAAEINKSTGNTGISASASGDELNLVQANGEDIRITDFTHSVASASAKVQAVSLSNAGEEQLATAVTLTDDTNINSMADSTVVSGNVYFDSSERFSVTSSIATNSGSIVNAAVNTSVSSTEETLANSNVSEELTAKQAMRVIDSALDKINSQRADLGATQNRFSSTISNIKTANENIIAASSQIKDADYAVETTELTKSQILSQAATAMLAQANQAPQGVLSLLQYTQWKSKCWT